MKHLTKVCFVFTLLLLCSYKLIAQQKATAPVKLFFEKVYVHTDRDVYAQGDTIWYKAYMVNAQNNTPIFSSGNLYAELISKDSSNIISRQILHLTGGTANAEFALSDSIPAGKYLLRAYTNWMRNFGDNFVFEKDITVLNTLSATNTLADKNKPSGNKKISSVAAKNNTKPNGISVHFYPEGGSLVEGVNSLVAVKAENSLGKGIFAKGAILSSTGDTAATFNCDTLGMGIFLLMPAKGQVYHATVNKQSFNIKQALVKGFSIRVTHRDTLINVIVSCNDAALAESTGKSFTLSGKHGGKTYFRQQLTITGNQSLVNISDAVFPDGIVALTLLEDGKDQSKPHSERLIYIHHAVDTTLLSVKTDKTVYQAKEKVTAYIKTNGGKASLSFASVDASVVPVQAGNIVTYLELQSELKGMVEKPARYFDPANVNRFKQLDLLLMTQGWRDFVWRRMQDTAIRLSYNLENGLAVSGKVLSGNSGKPLNHLNITMFANSNKGTRLFSSSSDSLGRFLFTGLEQYGDHNVKLSAADNKGEKKGAFDVDTLSILPVKTYAQANVPDTANTVLNAAAVKRRTEVLSEKMRGRGNLKEVNIKAKRVVINLMNGLSLMSFGPEQSFDITPKDYEFKTLEWWALHNIKGATASNELDNEGNPITGIVIPCVDTVRIAANNEGYGSRTVSLAPQFFINGRDYSTDNNIEAEAYRNTYYKLPINVFKKVVVKHFVALLKGQSVDRYFLFLTLKDDAMIGYNPGVLNPELKGYYQAKTFYKPLYDSPALQTKTDLRATLHWEPNITTDANGEATVTFYNADPKGKIRIVAEGVTDKGVPVSTTATYIVK
ncbi:MAG: hypothetical protein ABIN91_05215 [Mucilaginibacter sp.]|uniref:hypothetical protein n=1 Tax=Mucilaginibacter sp. TaxID=1882438 RepID=UPI003265278B